MKTLHSHWDLPAPQGQGETAVRAGSRWAMTIALACGLLEMLALLRARWSR